MSLRQRALSCLFLICVSLLAHARAHGASWVGTKILLKSPAVRGGELVRGEVINTHKLERVDYTVLQEQGAWIQVADRSGTRWLAREDAVPVKQAKAYFTIPKYKEPPPERLN